MTRNVRSGALWLAIGLALLITAQLAAPIVTAPLFDGIPVEDPYRFLNPPAGAQGDPTSAAAETPLDNGQSPQIFAATQENPPQAQLIADAGAFVLPAGTTALKTSITPIPPPGTPKSGVIAGNVYRVTVSNQAGATATVRAGTTVTFVLRAPRAIPNGVIAIYTASEWKALPTVSGGLPDLYAANIAVQGDFAVIAPPGSTVGPAPSTPIQASPSVPPFVPDQSGGGPNPALFVVIGVVLGVALLGIWELWQRRPPPEPPMPPKGGRRR
jgi:hypothetical protein